MALLVDAGLWGPCPLVVAKKTGVKVLLLSVALVFITVAASSSAFAKRKEGSNGKTFFIIRLKESEVV